MNREEITAGLDEASGLPKGRLKSERLELLASAAKTLQDPALEARVLLELSRAYEYGGERDRSPLAFARLLKLLDEFPAEVGDSSYSIHWQLKWMTYALVRNPEVPVAVANRWLAEMESRYRQRGYSLRPVHALRSVLALSQGDGVAASAAMEASIAAPRDQMADCDACERNDWGYWRAELGDDEGAIAFWDPVISGERRCAEEPHRVLGLALLPLVRLGHTDAARSAYLKGYPLARRNLSMRRTVGQHIEFCALTGNEARGLEILAEHATWLSDQQEDVMQRYQFCGGAAVLLRRLVALGHGEVPVGGGTAAGVLAGLEAELADIAARYDRRNGNTFTSERLAARLAQEPLTDWLPLGVSGSLPDSPALGRSTSSGTANPATDAAEPWDAVQPLLVQAEQELGDGDPVAAEKLARQAIQRGGLLIPQEAAAHLYSLLAEALRCQPDRDLDFIDASLKASARWDGLSEPDMLHQRFTAAMTYGALGRHAEAVALFEDVISRVDVPYDRLGSAQARQMYGESLRKLGRHREAAEPLLQTAASLQDDVANQRPYAAVASSAAEALQNSGQREEALLAFGRAASAWEALGEPIPAVRCRRSIAWLVLQNGEPQRAIELMREALDGIREALNAEGSATISDTMSATISATVSASGTEPSGQSTEVPPPRRAEDLAAEIAATEKQLERMVQQTERRARYLAARRESGEDDEY